MTSRRAAIAFTLFSEARVGRDAHGQVAAMDSALGDQKWLRGLWELQDARVAVRVNPGTGTGKYVLTGRVVELPYYVGGLQLMCNLPRLIRTVNQAVAGSRVIITRLPGIVGLIATAAAVLRRKPIATEIVGDVEDVLKSGSAGFLGKLMIPLVGAITRIAIRRAQVVRYVTEQTLQGKYPPHHAASTFAFSDVVIPQVAENRVVHKAAHPTVIAVGSQEQMYKGHDVLISAIKIVQGHIPEVKLILIGAGARQDSLRQQTRRLDLEEAVTFAGHIGDREQLIHMLREAWVFAMPSRTEGLPRALVEAMALGAACVGSRVGGIQELLESDQLVAPGRPSELAAAITKLLLDESERDRQGERNRKRTNAFNAELLELRRQQWSHAVIALDVSGDGGRIGGRA